MFIIPLLFWGEFIPLDTVPVYGHIVQVGVTPLPMCMTTVPLHHFTTGWFPLAFARGRSTFSAIKMSIVNAKFFYSKFSFLVQGTVLFNIFGLFSVHMFFFFNFLLQSRINKINLIRQIEIKKAHETVNNGRH